MSSQPAAPRDRTRRPAVARERVDGVLLLDKPRGVSSNHALLAVRRLLGAEKAGHGGTLDPMASGLLPVLFGEATKFAHDLLEADKSYFARLVLGETSTTADAEGTISPTHRAPPPESDFREVLRQFAGPIVQVPPMHSALKHQGRPLYDYARSGLNVERQGRTVTIHSIELLEFSAGSASIRVTCSKGTYVRTLVEDIGQAAGCGAWLGDLRRESVAGMNLTDSRSIESLEAMDLPTRRAALAPLDTLLQTLPRVDLAVPEALRFSQGQRLRVAPRSLSAALLPNDAVRCDRVRVYQGARLLGIATLDDGVIAPQRLLAQPPVAPLDDSPSLT